MITQCIIPESARRLSGICRITLTFILALFIFLSLQSTTLASELPDLGKPSRAVLSQAQEQKLAKIFMQRVRESATLVRDPLISHYIENLGKRIVAYSRDSHNSSFNFFVLNNQAINAFAGPGGNIGINSQLILVTENESQLASVIAHEVAHITQNHIARAYMRAKEQMIPSLASILAAIALGTQDPNAGLGAATASITNSTQSMIDFTRSNEQEADRIAMQTLHEAGFSAREMPKLLRLFQRQASYQGSRSPEFLRTHPLTNSRIADTENRAIRYPKQKVLPASQYSLIKERLRVMTNLKLYQLQEEYKARLADPTNKSQSVIKYGSALTELALQKPNKAVRQFKQLVNKHPNEPLFQIGLSNAYLANQQSINALATLKKAIRLFHENYVLTLTYADTLLQMKQSKQASHVLLKLLRNFPNDERIISKLARSKAAENKLPEAYYYFALALLSQQQTEQAKQYLHRALKRKSISQYTKAMIQAKLKEIHLIKQ